ncbi:uncharacterized protein [Triticum aestivum]|uniref:uncharacterized protein n=1 Tax=Triticum aestivum TaxID=4565 RepID=UPI001D011E22|nr:uncharacterized protein LOC123084348 [Triticum aestivum]
MATPTNEPTITMETCGDVSDNPTMETISVLSDVPIVSKSLPTGAVSANFKVTPGFGGITENAKVNIDMLYLRQIMTGWEANQSDVINPNTVTGLGKTVVNNWGIYDGPGSKAKLVAKTHGMHTFAGKWSNWFTLVFVVDRFEASTLQVMGANDEDEADNDWAIVGGTGEFTMARGIIQRRVYSVTDSTLTHALTIEFFCRMKEVVPSPTKRGTVGGNRGTLPYILGGHGRSAGGAALDAAVGTREATLRSMRQQGGGSRAWRRRRKWEAWLRGRRVGRAGVFPTTQKRPVTALQGLAVARPARTFWISPDPVENCAQAVDLEGRPPEFGARRLVGAAWLRVNHQVKVTLDHRVLKLVDLVKCSCVLTSAPLMVLAMELALALGKMVNEKLPNLLTRLRRQRGFCVSTLQGAVRQ